ncbi:hypothetical protein ACQY0O_002564 [Thecaphora frezii]
MSEPADASSAAFSGRTSAPRATASGSSSRRPRQRPVTYCLPPPTFHANVTEADAQLYLHKLVAHQAKQQGFEATSSSALHELSHLVERFVLSLYASASHAAELANRDVPSARDLTYALETHGLPIPELRHFAREQQATEAYPHHLSERVQAKSRTTFAAPTPRIIPVDASTYRVDDRYAWIDPTSAFLASDSDSDSQSDAWSVTSESDGGGGHAHRRAAFEARVQRRKERREKAEARRKRREQKMASDETGQRVDVSALEEGERAWKKVADHIVPRHLPGRPPRHCWIETPAYPPNAYSSGGASGSVANNPLVLVNRKLANARLVEASLRKLIQTTDSVAALAFEASRATQGATAEAGDRTRQASANDQSEAADPAAAGKPSSAPPPLPASSSADSVFAMPRLSSRAGLTLRLRNKVSTPTTPAPGGADPGFMTTPLLPRMQRNPMLTPGAGAPMTPLTGSGFASLDPLASPATPIAGFGGPMTPYPPTPADAFSNHYFGSQLGHTYSWSNANATAIPRSRSGSIAAPGSAAAAASQGGEAMAVDGELTLPARLPGAVNYKNAWYSPGTSHASGKKAAGAESRGVKRMRKWKV